MTESAHPGYHVVPCGSAKADIGEIMVRAIALGRRAEVVEAIEKAPERMSANPLGWGDPECRLHEMALLKCHGTSPPLIVLYAVDEVRHLVYVHRVLVIPNHP